MESFSYFGSFNSKIESWSLYSERLDQFFIATKVTTDEMKRAQLLTFIGAETYATLRNIVSPTNPKDKSYKDLTDALATHFNPVPSEIISRYKFNMRERQAGETIAVFLSELRKMSEFCKYGTSLNDMLRDRLVCGCRDDTLQKRLLSEDNLTLAKATQIAQAMESASRNLLDIKNQTALPSSENVNAISLLHRKKRSNRKSKQQSHQNQAHAASDQGRHCSKCFRCNDTGHTASDCPFRESKCHKCTKLGHISRACRSNPRKSSTNQINHQASEYEQEITHQGFRYNVFPEYELQESRINQLVDEHGSKKLPAPYQITVTINNMKMDMEVDTGSAYSLLPSSKAYELLKTYELKPLNMKLTSFSGHEVDVAGVIYPVVKYKQVKDELPLVIYCGHGPTLCGRTWTSSRLPILQNGVKPQLSASVSHVITQKTELEDILDKHEELFNDQLGCLRDVKVHLHRKSNVHPIFHKARSVPYALKEKVENELKRMEDAGILHANADALSRLPIPAPQGDIPLPVETVLLIQELNSGPITSKHIESEMKNDYTLTTVLQQLRTGWKSEYISGEFNPYYRRRLELSTQGNLLLIGRRVIIPESLRNSMLRNLHETHQGMVKMKAIARSIFWWPNLDKDIEDIVRECKTCQAVASDPPKTFIPWPTPERPWQRVHMDFAGPVEGKMLFIVIDAHSKWMECEVVNSTSTETVIRCLRPMLARFGIMNTLVSDNAPCFTSSDFSSFINSFGINHLKIAPYHPQSNGQAERTVRIVKGSLKKLSGRTSSETEIIEMGLDVFRVGTLEERISKILMRYRRTPLSKGKSPAELQLGRNILTTVDLCHPKSTHRNAQQYTEVVSRKQRFEVNQPVNVRNFSRGAKWDPGIITRLIGNNMYEVQVDKRTLRKHQNQLLSRQHVSGIDSAVNSDPEKSACLPVAESSHVESPVIIRNSSCPPVNQSEPSSNPDQQITVHGRNEIDQPTSEPQVVATDQSLNAKDYSRDEQGAQQLRRSERIKKPVSRLGL